ncbi:MAG: hypothetical protein ACI4F0_09135 [Agathobacter sp.]
MKTNYVPALITLSAGLVDCIISFRSHLSMYEFTKQLLLVLFIFYVIGCLLQFILKKAMKAFEDKKEEVAEEENEQKTPLENIDSSEE